MNSKPNARSSKSASSQTKMAKSPQNQEVMKAITKPSYIRAQLEYFKNAVYKTDELWKLRYDFNEKIGTIPMSTVMLPKGSLMYRCRANKGIIPYENIALLSINSKDRTRRFGRAHCPGRPAFYASTHPNVAIYEATQWHIDDCFTLLSKGIDAFNIQDYDYHSRFLTVSTWELQKDIVLCPFINETIISKEYKTYEVIAEQRAANKAHYPNNVWQSLNMIQEFFTEQFTKRNVSQESDYMLSAMCADIVYQKREGDSAHGIELYHGITYSSIANSLKGFNYAISEAAFRQGVVKFVSADQVYAVNPNAFEEMKGIKGIENIYGITATGKCLNEASGAIVWEDFAKKKS